MKFILLLLFTFVWTCDQMEKVSDVYITFYGFDDNDSGQGTSKGTSAIAHPVIHKEATEDIGSYDHPSTFAASKKYFNWGDIIYIPRIQKYYIMEDICVEAEADAKKDKIHVDLYIGGNSHQGKPLIECEDKLTSNGFNDTIIKLPATNLTVYDGKLFSNGTCSYPKGGLPK